MIEAFDGQKSGAEGLDHSGDEEMLAPMLMGERARLGYPELSSEEESRILRTVSAALVEQNMQLTRAATLEHGHDDRNLEVILHRVKQPHGMGDVTIMVHRDHPLEDGYEFSPSGE